MKTAYLDCFSGISGDMFVGALLDAGLNFEDLKTCLRTLPFKGYHLEMKRETRNRIGGTRFVVRLESETTSHRHLKDVLQLIEKGSLSRRVKEQCMEVFKDLARVEGQIHGSSPEEVHFHEVGGEDSIIDIVGTLYGIEKLGLTCLYASPLPLGSGFVEAAHGRIPLPAPATLALLKGIPVTDSGVKKEMVTPTGAALVKCLVRSFGEMPPMVIRQIGYGVGERILEDRPNLLRILIGEEVSPWDSDTVVVMETNVDDTNPEWLGFLMERLFECGALDVGYGPVQMKKNRPGIQIQVLAPPDRKDPLMRILFRESGTLGIRFHHAQRKVFKRSEQNVESPC